MVKLPLRVRRWRRRLRRFLQSRRGKLASVIGVMLLLFTGAITIEQLAIPSDVWLLSCSADGYFSAPQFNSEHPIPDKLTLLVNIEHQQAALHYQLESGTGVTEFIVMQGKVTRRDLRALSYQLALKANSVQWQDDSRLHPYLLNELSYVEQSIKLNAPVLLDVQIRHVDSPHSRVLLTFMSSNSLWSCQVN
ncbi:hypothetical protein K8B83_19610 [Shewanella inventionis]|uniref:hypothetical protein n=1 Tax=Shewanella inventionis TaxID=1738770 RepID=UPI001CBAAF2A|nr:hypothetical protein [Shewanella inventionis]UAL42983.1 hypothetical protein K8B83_19610 [Shewanella inventionis]